MIKVNLQIKNKSLRKFQIPATKTFERWAEAILRLEGDMDTEVVVRVIDELESYTLNRFFRKDPEPTNVLAFPYEPAPAPVVESNYLGDIAITAPIVVDEAEERCIKVRDHWAHLFIHAVLHLLGYDHQSARQEKRMQARETEILESLSIPSPWRIEDEAKKTPGKKTGGKKHAASEYSGKGNGKGVL